MMPTNPVSGDVTSQLVSLALNAALARHMAAATNIANANNEGYSPLHVSFDDQLAAMRNRFTDRRFDASAGRLIESLQGSIRPVENPAAERVQLDVETSRMVQNAVQYQALLSGLNKMTAITRMAISGGRQ